MKFEHLEKKINKLDKDIEALGRSKHYLNNKDEINEVCDYLNQERQVYANELYAEDYIGYAESIKEIKNLIGIELLKDEQLELLEKIKENYGRKSPNVSKKAYGLNAWLKFLDVNCRWIEIEDKDWAKLIIDGYIPKTNNN